MYLLTKEDIILLTSHYSQLTRQEKWSMLVFLYPEMKDKAPKRALQANVASEKRASFLRYLKNTPIMQLKDQYKRASIDYVCLGSADYPYMLEHSYDPPFILFIKGNASLLKRISLGVVGARECSAYGIHALKKLLPPLVDSSLVITSGLAKGIDRAAHELTINGGGETIAVIGTGLDVCYPRENRDLQSLISQSHLLISEYPLKTAPKKHHFPMRNRIIAGLSKGVLVVESRERSGSLITARMALEEGRDVFSIPGSILSDLSGGCNELLKLGAIPVTSGEDILMNWTE